MKTFCVTLFLVIGLFGFTQSAINYKAVIKDGNGNVIADDLIVIQFTIREASENGTIIYQENHTPTTDNNGIVILGIGSGTPLVGSFATIDWISNTHYLNVQINLGGGLEDMGTTPFAAVPYAYAARTASNVFSGDYNDLDNLPSITTPSGLEQITEDGDTGWRLIASDPNNYGDIGDDAVDLSISATSSSSFGATGIGSVALGTENIASGSFSTTFGNSNIASSSYATATGRFTEASGLGSFSTGFNSKAQSLYSTAFGRYNIGGGASNNWNDSDPLFEIGNGSNDANRNNAFTLLKNGFIGINDETPAYLVEINNDNLSQRSINIRQNGSDTDAGTQYGMFIDVDKTNTVAFAAAYGIRTQIENLRGDALGYYGWGTNRGTSVGDAYGIRALAENDNGTGLVYAVYATILNSTSSGDKYAGYFDGDVFTTGSYLPSDENLKKNITPANESALNKILNLPVENYTYKNDQYGDMKLPRGLRTGFTAQNLEKVMPELVKTATRPAPTQEEIEAGATPTEEIQFKAVDYTGIVPYLVKAIQELKKENDQLRTRLEALENN
ncbi:tail fiber domain-containing protein [Winogradskyella sp.]|uniref:tail fiber domain-containing protein n=1 Tax=Winogradskyella sp. TaxID=1883156 RepID=UPI003BAD8416